MKFMWGVVFILSIFYAEPFNSNMTQDTLMRDIPLLPSVTGASPQYLLDIAQYPDESVIS